MNLITGLCALLTIACSGSQAHHQYKVLGMVAGSAREALAADWDAHLGRPGTPERMYEVTRDSISAWRVPYPGDSARADTVLVLYVLEVRPVRLARADAMTSVPASSPLLPTIHTHGMACSMTRWGVDPGSCSGARPDSYQCQASPQDERSQRHERHRYDAVQCGRDQFAFYYLPAEDP